MIVAKTIKGRGFSEVEDSPDWHGRPFPPEMARRAITELGGVRNLVLRGPRPAATPGSTELADTEADQPAQADAPPPQYALGDKVATRKAYGDALVALGARDPQVVALDGEVSNSTYAREFARAYPRRYFEMFIAEQQLVAAATGLAVRGYRPFASTFAAFWTRAYDFIRMGAISGVDLRLVGSHAGVEIGADGPSQMGLEDLAMMRVVHGSTVLYPRRRHQRRRARRRDGHHSRHQLPAHHPRRLPRHLLRRRDFPRRRCQAVALQRPGQRDPDRRGRHAPCLPARR